MAREIIVLDSSYVNLVHADKYLGPFKAESRENPETPITVRRHLRIETYLDRLRKLDGNPANEILPRNCRYKESAGGYTTYVMEDEPCIRSVPIDFSITRDKEELKKAGTYEKYNINEMLQNKTSNGGVRLNLSLPYVVYIITLDSGHRCCGMQVYFRMHPITSFGDQLYYANFSNINSDGYLCLGSSISQSKMRSPEDGIEEAMSRFWYNGFNDDYIYNIKRYKDANIPYVSNHLEWAAMTAEDPLFIYDVPWILHERKLNHLVNKSVRMYASSRDDNSLNYRKLVNLFSSVEKTEVPGGDPKEQYVENVSAELYLSDGCTVEVGEEFPIDGKKYILDALIGDADYTIRFIRAEDEDGNLVDIKYDNAFQNKLKKELSQQKEISSIVIGETEVKVGDTVKYQINNGMDMLSLGELKTIRKLRNNVVEVVIGRNAYILENVSVWPVDTTKISVNGVPVEKGMKFYYRGSNDATVRKSLTDIYYEAEYQSLDSSNGSPSIVFRYVTNKGDGSSSTYKLRLDSNLTPDDESIAVKTDDLIPMESINMETLKPLSIYTHFHRLVTPSEANPHYSIDGVPGILKFSSDSNMPYDHSKALRYMLKDDGSELYIPGIHHDTHFITGDQVVVADWTIPEEMLKVKTISGFTYNEETQLINVVVFNNDEPDKLINVPFVNVGHALVLTGKIRKITTDYPGLSAGYKVRCKIAWVPAFPKKDVNIVIGVMETPGDDPLVLFSNYATLPLSFVLKDFSIYTPNSGYYKNLEVEVVDNPAVKYKHQLGDLVQLTSGVGSGPFSTLIYTSVRRRDSYGAFHKYLVNPRGPELREEYEKTRLTRCIRFGFLSPRLSQAQQQDISGKRYFPDMYGGIVEDEKSYLCL